MKSYYIWQLWGCVQEFCYDWGFLGDSIFRFSLNFDFFKFNFNFYLFFRSVLVNNIWIWLYFKEVRNATETHITLICGSPNVPRILQIVQKFAICGMKKERWKFLAWKLSKFDILMKIKWKQFKQLNFKNKIFLFYAFLDLKHCPIINLPYNQLKLKNY
jgi:hypothetical protein